MSNTEITLASSTVSDGTSDNCNKNASQQNAATNPVEYFQSSKLRYYFTNPTMGYYNSSGVTMPESETYNDRLEGNIFAFSRKIVYKRSARFDSILKRKKIKEIRKLAKYKNDLKKLIETMLELSCKKRELVEKITTLSYNIKSCVSKTPTKLNTNMNKCFKGTIILTKSNEVIKSHKEKKCFLGKKADVPLQTINPLMKNNDESNCTQMRTKHGDKLLRRKYLMLKYNIRPSFQRKRKRYITYIRLGYKLPKSHLEDSQDHTKSEEVNAAPLRSPSPVLFMGKDPIYPAELNELFKPDKCDLCHTIMFLPIMAHRHYISESHDRKITNWCHWNYTANGVEPPKGRKYIIKIADQSEYYCQLCNVRLPSSRHALQHFNGKRHRIVHSKKAPVSGIGYFNLQGNWVQTGKVIDESTGIEINHVLVKTSTGIEKVVLFNASITSSVKKTGKTSLHEPLLEVCRLDRNIPKSDELGSSKPEIGGSVIFERENNLETNFEEVYSEVQECKEHTDISEEKPFFEENHGELQVCNENTVGEKDISEERNMFEEELEYKHGEIQACEDIIQKVDITEEENFYDEKFGRNHGEMQSWNENIIEELDISEDNQDEVQLCNEKTDVGPEISEEEKFEASRGDILVCNENKIDPDSLAEENFFDAKFEDNNGEGQVWSKITIEETVVSKQENTFEDKHGHEQTSSDNTVNESVVSKIVNSLIEEQSERKDAYGMVQTAVEELGISKERNSIRVEQSARKPRLTVKNIEMLMDQQETSVQNRPECFNMQYPRFYSSTDHDSYEVEDSELTSYYSKQSVQGMQTPKDAMDTLSCMLCNIKTTSKQQMFGHLKGTRHAKKMQLIGETPRRFVTVADSLLLDDPKDISIYRTPSGFYYCDACRVRASTPGGISYHLASKKHCRLMRKKKKLEY